MGSLSAGGKQIALASLGVSVVLLGQSHKQLSKVYAAQAKFDEAASKVKAFEGLSKEEQVAKFEELKEAIPQDKRDEFEQTCKKTLEEFEQNLKKNAGKMEALKREDPEQYKALSKNQEEVKQSIPVKLAFTFSQQK